LTKLLYIGGYGRSGSTLLEYLLAARSDVVACGEIMACAHELTAPRCSCGQPRNLCPVWGAVLARGAPSGSWTHQALTRALLASVANDYALLIDSSKTAWQSFRMPFVFRQELGEDFRLIHTVRDPHGVCWSNVAGKRRRRGKLLPEIQNSPRRFIRHLRTLLGWWAANLDCEVFAWRHPTQYVRVRYEDLVNAPEETLDQIFRKLRLGPGPKLDDLSISKNRHQLFGNRVRYRAPSRSDIRPDVRWTKEMKPLDRWLVSAFSWPLRARYDY